MDNHSHRVGHDSPPDDRSVHAGDDVGQSPLESPPATGGQRSGMTWEQWAIAFIVAALTANGLARILVLAGAFG